MLKGKKILITAGPTRERLDPIRFFTNPSSGRMGFSLVHEATRRGARVTLVAGPTEASPPRCHRVIRVVSAREMLAAVLRVWKGADAVIAAAAVCDWRPARMGHKKIKKPRHQSASLSVPLVLNPDILKTLSDLKSRRGGPLPVLVGFALETNDLLKNASAKLNEKRLDLVVANSPQALESSGAQVSLLAPGGGRERLGLMSKTSIAKKILDFVEGRLAESAAL